MLIRATTVCECALLGCRYCQQLLLLHQTLPVGQYGLRALLLLWRSRRKLASFAR